MPKKDELFAYSSNNLHHSKMAWEVEVIDDPLSICAISLKIFPLKVKVKVKVKVNVKVEVKVKVSPMHDSVHWGSAR